MNYDLWLILLKISNNKKNFLVDKYKTSENVYNNFEKIISEDKFLRKKLINFKKNYLQDEVEKLEEEIYKKQVGYITYANPLYKEKLKGIEEPPHFLFYKGKIDVINSKSIAVVGSRKCSNYGFNVTKLLTKELITNNITLISGGARGIDSIAHKTALENDGINIAVMGCGIDKVYPAENKTLFSNIQENGVIISEFLLGTDPFPYNFPRRNRIISGLSSGVVVTEARKNSGAIITARYALEKGKNVMIVPGSVFCESSRGSNELLGEGKAQTFTCMDDFRSFIDSNYINIEPLKYPPQKSEILDILSDIPIHIDDILKNSSVDRGALYALLFEMQIKDEIICLPGNYYMKTL